MIIDSVVISNGSDKTNIILKKTTVFSDVSGIRILSNKSCVNIYFFKYKQF